MLQQAVDQTMAGGNEQNPLEHCHTRCDSLIGTSLRPSAAPRSSGARSVWVSSPRPLRLCG